MKKILSVFAALVALTACNSSELKDYQSKGYN